MVRKKVVLIVVEGPSDEVALQVPLANVFDQGRVFVQTAYGDVTSDRSSRPSNIVSKVHALIKEHMSRYRYRKSDMGLIVHIMDLDGAYVPDEAIREIPGAARTLYNVSEILTADRESICERNARKRENMDRLASLRTIAGMPYLAVYMSCNLDHALYNKLNTLDSDKRRDSFAFARRYADDRDGFVDFIADSEIAVQGTARETWDYVREGLRSLDRHTNLGICFGRLGQGPVGRP